MTVRNRLRALWCRVVGHQDWLSVYTESTSASGVVTTTRVFRACVTRHPTAVEDFTEPV